MRSIQGVVRSMRSSMRSSVCIYFNRPYSRTEKEILFVFIFRYALAAYVSTRGLYL